VLAQSDAFRAAISLVEECTGIRARAWKRHAGIVVFLESNATDILRRQIRDAGFHLVTQNANLLLFPTSSKFAVVACCDTSGINYGITTRDLIRKLIALDRQAPFHLLGCGSDWLEGQLVQRPDANQANQLVNQLSTLSPDLACDKSERAHTVWQLIQYGRFRLWWD
jgi:hypothetical protein